jgi:pyruvate,water dikinase
MPEPTPMTWALFHTRLMAGGGGAGRMYRDLGFDPDPALEAESGFDLVAARPLSNLSRMPRLSFGDAPFEYPFADLKKDPAKALNPTPTPNPWRDGLSSAWKCFKALWRMTRIPAKAAELGNTFPERFRTEVVPTFVAEAEVAATLDLTSRPAGEVVEFFETWVRRTLVEFASDSLKPTFLATFALESLRQLLGKPLGPERTAAALNELQAGVRPDPEADLPAAVKALAAGRLARDEFLRRFGHRGPQDMELASPRWSEIPDAVDRFLVRSAHTAVDEHSEFDWRQRWERVAAEAKVTGPAAARGAAEVERLRSALTLRETAKHHLMRGYALVRRALVELDRRFALHGGIFHLTPDELPRLLAGESLAAEAAARRKRRQLLLGLEVPAVVFSDDLDAVGRPVPSPTGGVEWSGLALSGGVAEGPALVLTEPAPPPPEPFVLVCPSTDPAWVPLFAEARGLVMETGGVLSHGAIVAREYGLPAVGGLAGVVRGLRTGQRVRVDGNRGVVSIVG